MCCFQATQILLGLDLQLGNFLGSLLKGCPFRTFIPSNVYGIDDCNYITRKPQFRYAFVLSCVHLGPNIRSACLLSSGSVIS
jgi:hypothetical protein